jgi:translation elongation factor EF-Ts
MVSARPIGRAEIMVKPRSRARGLINLLKSIPHEGENGPIGVEIIAGTDFVAHTANFKRGNMKP